MFGLEGENMAGFFLLQIPLSYYSEMLFATFRKSLCFKLVRGKKEKSLESTAKPVRSN